VFMCSKIIISNIIVDVFKKKISRHEYQHVFARYIHSRKDKAWFLTLEPAFVSSSGFHIISDPVCVCVCVCVCVRARARVCACA